MRLSNHFLARRSGRCWLALLALVLAGVAQAGVVRHLMWDASQRPAYQQCARDFEQSHPGITVRLQQQGWDDYWTTLATGFISDTAPDVFVNHLSKYPEFVENQVLVDLAPLIAKDQVATGQYLPGLYENWSRNGHQYALPADWDTVTLLVNLDIARRAGVSAEQLAQLRWNPQDGGTFGRVAAMMTLDQAGHSALDANFDAKHVLVRGFQFAGTGGMMGQTEWSFLAASNGFAYQDQRWSAALHYDDPRLAQTLAWMATLTQRGITATPQVMGKLGADAMFATGRAGMVAVGSWMTSYFNRSLKFAHAWVPLPIGPNGRRVSMLNGVGHSLWVGSKNREQAWQWLRYLGSADCQKVVAQAGVVYPAVAGLEQITLEVQRRSGAQAQVFWDAARGPTVAPPIAPHAAEVNALMDSAIEGILYAQQPALPRLRQAQQAIDELMHTD